MLRVPKIVGVKTRGKASPVIFSVPLTQTQLNAFEALKWLFDEHTQGRRQTGRTYLMAVVYISLALDHIGEWIAVRDHYPHTVCHDLILTTIGGICVGTKLYPYLEIDRKSSKFRIKEKVDIGRICKKKK